MVRYAVANTPYFCTLFNSHSLDKEYEWIMHPRHSHILSEGTNTIYPLFVVFNQTSERIQRGLVGADLPFVKQIPITLEEQEYQVSYQENAENP
jgi:hypothetical protein